jgi:hypothetical protein
LEIALQAPSDDARPRHVQFQAAPGGLLLDEELALPKKIEIAALLFR